MEALRIRGGRDKYSTICSEYMSLWALLASRRSSQRIASLDCNNNNMTFAQQTQPMYSTYNACNSRLKTRASSGRL